MTISFSSKRIKKKVRMQKAVLVWLAGENRAREKDNGIKAFSSVSLSAEQTA